MASRNNNNQKKDDADLFREQSLRAIRHRKLMAKGMYWLLIVMAILVIAAVFIAYFVDK